MRRQRCMEREVCMERVAMERCDEQCAWNGVAGTIMHGTVYVGALSGRSCVEQCAWSSVHRAVCVDGVR
jgi:hypothetical protein